MTLKELVAEFKTHDVEFLEELREELDDVMVEMEAEEEEDEG